MKKTNAYPELVFLLRMTLEDGKEKECGLPLTQWLVDAYIDWGDAQQEPEQKIAKYQEAMRLKTVHVLNSDVPGTRLKEAERQRTERDRLAAERVRLEQEKRRPAVLPKGAKAGVLRVVADHDPPALVCDLWVEDEQGNAIRSLAEKDFLVTVNGEPAAAVWLSEFEPQPEPLHTVLAMDISGSMAGEPLVQAKKGGKAFLVNLKMPNGAVRVLSFAKDVQWCCEWTADAKGATASLDRLQADGATALYKAAATAIADLQHKKGQKAVVLFTDGADSGPEHVGGPTLDEVISRAQKEKIAFFCIGLKTPELMPEVMRRLAHSTGGKYYEANQQQDLMDRFEMVSRSLRRNGYRLVIRPANSWKDASRKGALEVAIGDGTALRVLVKE